MNYPNARPREYYAALLQQQQQLLAQVPSAIVNQLNRPQFQAPLLQPHQHQGLLPPLNTPLVSNGVAEAPDVHQVTTTVGTKRP